MAHDNLVASAFEQNEAASEPFISNVITLKLLMRGKFMVLTEINPLHTSLCKSTNPFAKATIRRRMFLVIGTCRLRKQSCFWKKLPIFTECSSWSLYKQRIRSMWTVVILCFILLKSGSYAVIVCHYAPIISFMIGIELVTNFAIQGRRNGVSYGRFGEIRREISIIRHWYNRTDDKQDTESENEYDCEWS